MSFLKKLISSVETDFAKVRADKPKVKAELDNIEKALKADTPDIETALSAVVNLTKLLQV